jgi:hypothetical protein
MTTKGYAGLCAAVVAAFLVLPFCYRPATAQGKDEVDRVDQEKIDAREKKGDGEGDESKPRIFSLDAGIQGNYAAGVSTSSLYYQPFFDIYLKHKYVKFTAGLSRFQNVQISNGSGQFETVNFTQPKLGLSLYPHRMIEFFGEYYYSTGDKNKHYYRSHEGTAGFFLDFEKVTLGTTVTGSRTEYHFKSDDLKDKTIILLQSLPLIRYMYYKKRYISRLEDLDVYPELSWFVHRTTSLDVKYEYRESKFEYVLWDYQYHDVSYGTHTGRLGVYSEPWRYFSLKAGVYAGKDSDDYIIAGGDVGVTFNILDYVKISSTYTPEYYIAPNVNVVQQRFVELVSMVLVGRRLKRNPSLRFSDIGKSFWNHSVSFSAMYTY